MSGRDSWVGKRVLLLNKKTGEEKSGEIISDPPHGETRFKTDEGDEIGAYEWAYRLEVR